jgi:cation:H+ antiporter
MIKSGSLLVKTLIKIARFLGLSAYLVSFVLMSFACSIPEIFVGVTSALHKTPIISLGNVFGSNILKLTLGIGLVILFSRGIKVKTGTTEKDAWLVFFLALAPFVLIFDGTLSRIDGVILISLFFWYLSRLVGRREQLEKTFNSLKNHNGVKIKTFFKSVFSFCFGLFILLIASYGAVKSASLIAQEIGLSLFFIGLILVSIGTSLPEIVFGLSSAVGKHEELCLGNFIGSVAFNALFVLGLASIICPIQVGFNALAVSAIFAVLSLVVFNVFIRTEKRLSCKEGIILVFIYVLFLTAELVMSKMIVL